MDMGSKIAKRMRETARSKRVPTDYETTARIRRRKRSELVDKHGTKRPKIAMRLTDGRPSETLDRWGYQKHIYDPGRIVDIALTRRFFYPGYGARLMDKSCLTATELSVALGMGERKIPRLIERREFPTPLGMCYLHNRTDSSTPAYTVREAMTYMLLLHQEVGSPEKRDYWDRVKYHVCPILFAARRSMHRMVYENHEPRWSLKDDEEGGN